MIDYHHLFLLLFNVITKNKIAAATTKHPTSHPVIHIPYLSYPARNQIHDNTTVILTFEAVKPHAGSSEYYYT